MACLATQLPLIGVQIAEQDACLPLAHVETGQPLQLGGVIAAVADRDVQAQLVGTGAHRLQ